MNRYIGVALAAFAAVGGAVAKPITSTRDPKWLARARSAANYAETWIYAWNVPMPSDDDNAKRHWKRGLSTVGVQLIASGHSLVDDYMCFDTDEYAKLYQYTGDAHYLAVA